MKNTLLFLCTLFFLSSCERVLFEPDLSSRDPLTNFDHLWNEVDKKYSYFNFKKIDWTVVKNKYRPLLSANTNEEELFKVFADMLNELKDDHVNLRSPFNISRYNVMLQHPENFRWRTIQEFYITDMWQTGPFKHGFLDDSEIGYIRYESLADVFDDSQLDFVLNRYLNTKGLILDLRQNRGGSAFAILEILSRFTATKKLAAYNITRNGPNHTDFSSPENFYITPYSGRRYLKPLMVLVDRGSYSATSLFALATKAFSNITLVGDTTGGGGGLPSGGQLPNGWTYRFTVSQVLDLNGNNFTEDGVPPDIKAAFDWSDLTKDEILERAILELQ